MTIGLVFWILMLLWLVFHFWVYWAPPNQPWAGWAPNVLLFVLMLLLGWATFGAPIRG